MLRDNKGRFVKGGSKPINRSTLGLLKGEAANNWRGGRRMKKNGYIEVRKPDHPTAHKDGYILEHRYVMEKYLARSLQKGEHIHHKNGDRSDNRIENLALLSLASHTAHHHRIGSYDKKNASQKGTYPLHLLAYKFAKKLH